MLSHVAPRSWKQNLDGHGGRSLSESGTCWQKQEHEWQATIGNDREKQEVYRRRCGVMDTMLYDASWNLVTSLLRDEWLQAGVCTLDLHSTLNPSFSGSVFAVHETGSASR